MECIYLNLAFTWPIVNKYYIIEDDSIVRIARKFGTDIHGSQMMNSKDSIDYKWSLNFNCLI